MHRSTLLLASLALLPGLLLGCGRRGGGGAGDAPPATELDISGVTINQAVEIELMDDGDEGDRNGPVVRGRDGLFRIYVERQEGWENRRIKGVVTLLDDGDVIESYDRERNVTGDSYEGDIDSTINVEVPGEEIRGGREYRVSIYEVPDESGGVGGDGDEGRNRWPEDEGARLEAESGGGPLRVLVVPIQYNADGSQRVPDTSNQQLDYYRDWITRLYPIDELEFEIADVMPWGYQVAANGPGWGELLNYMASNYREGNNIDDDVYVYGLFAPDTSYAGYCSQGCIAGLSYLSGNPEDYYARSSIGVGFFGEDAALTMAHEIGHAHGRGHAPCQVEDGIDWDYPYDNARLGVAGWDILDEELIEKDHAADVMSYCDPNWISDYNYRHLFDRLQDVNALYYVDGLEPTTWRRVLVGLDGSLSPAGADLRLTMPPGGLPRDADLIDADGDLLEQVEARFFPHSHIGGGLLLYPEPGVDAKALRLDGATLQL